MQDRGGRAPWTDYSLASSSGAGSSSTATGSSTTAATKPATTSTPPHGYTAPKYQAGYVPARTPSPKTQQRYQQPDPEPQPQPQHNQHSYTSSTPNISTESAPTASTSPPPAANLSIVTRVRALHTFEPTEPGELAFEKGDIIKVVDRGYKDWWRGQLKGRTGIFPVNYVVRIYQLEWEC
jgi:signal transducing adaptor molecule